MNGHNKQQLEYINDSNMKAMMKRPDDTSIYYTGSKRATIFNITAKDFSYWKIFEEKEFLPVFKSGNKNVNGENIQQGNRVN